VALARFCFLLIVAVHTLTMTMCFFGGGALGCLLDLDLGGMHNGLEFRRSDEKFYEDCTGATELECTAA